jgi:hypothetical protein
MRAMYALQEIVHLATFYVVANKSSCLSVVNYRITKIYRFLKRGWKERGEASQSKPVKDDERASLRRPYKTVHTKPD